jgi:hypothetical protein
LWAISWLVSLGPEIDESAVSDDGVPARTTFADNLLELATAFYDRLAAVEGADGAATPYAHVMRVHLVAAVRTFGCDLWQWTSEAVEHVGKIRKQAYR